MEATKNIYQENSFKNRKDYLENLAIENGVSFGFVKTVAMELGPGEDFDGLVTVIQDCQE